MNSGKQTKTKETLISIIILSIIILIFAALLVKQSFYNIEKYGIIKSEGSNTSGRSVDLKKIDFNQLKPERFNLMLNVEKYNRDILFEKINGKAPLYLESGFKELVTQRFQHSGNKKLWIEIYIYDQSNSKNAFSVYSLQRRSGSNTYTAAGKGYETSNAVYFIRGRYYFEIVGSASSKALLKAIKTISLKLSTGIFKGYKTKIDELKLFPPKSLIPESRKLYLNNAFGFKKFTNTYLAKYRIGNDRLTVYFSKRKNSGNAQNLMKEYNKFLINNGGVVINKKRSIPRLKIINLFNSYHLTVTKGSFILGIHEADKKNKAIDFLMFFAKKIK